jgi:hypothetical protein
MGPFNQQAFQYYPCRQAQPGFNATISRTSNYSPPDIYSYYDPDILNSPMKGAIYSGLFNPSSITSPVSYSCPSGNCSFTQPYTTLQVCSSCDNVIYGVNTTFGNDTGLDYDMEFTQYYNVTYLQSFKSVVGGGVLFQPPNGVQISSWNAMQSTADGFSGTGGHVDDVSGDVRLASLSLAAFTNTSCSTAWFNSSLRYPETDCFSPPDMLDQDNLDTANAYWADFGHSGSSWDYHNIMAVRCNLSYCLQTYNATVANGTLVEEPLDTKMVLVGTWGSHVTESLRPRYDLAYVPVPCYVEGKALQLDQAARKDYTGLDGTVVRDSNGSSFSVIDECLYSVAFENYEATKVFFSGQAQHHASGLFNRIRNWQGRAYNFNSLSAGPGDGLTFDPEWISPFWNNGSASFGHTEGIFQGVARSMSVHLRQSGNDSKPALGTVYVMQTCMQVNWYWMILPSSLVILSGIFLIIVVLLQTRHRDEPLWKGQLLALLATGLDADTRKEFDLVRGPAELEELAKRLRVRYEQSGNGWVWTKEKDE